ncbi:aminotransferase class I/II-fold pyridoxal phosphate-dependent enzyme [Methanocorpusculum bavaricum]|uniref:aminotransferase class I/II-fold pyridoxal phosphate-dependent enzyme n=1 Tax=Methanocorpusculum bavaricum TaxID=71518 RepID=UPI0009D6714E|nr:aminotransferase class V-fold PLP-dependent enzyme [Methanocorpusculum bavaricum]HJJ37448.1 aminotransferase class V-fold PLP-dependent enzyme [Methanocorpusculum sp.]
MSTLSIISFLTEHADKKTVSFHMPGHKGSAVYRRFGYGDFLKKMMDCDITEIPGADNLFQTEGILKAAQEKYARLYGVQRSYLLINGTSCGVIAAVMASVPKGKKLIMARNSHKAIFNALVLADIQPVYAYPEIISEYGISGGITADEIERCLDENPDAEAVILPSPNYYGICSDIRAIAEVVHKKGKTLIVDQAHGAHLRFFRKAEFTDMPESAEEQGADIVVNSIHKTLASFTQSAVLNLNSDRVDHYVLEDKLQMLESTSPSYLLMGSLDINAHLLEEHGKTLMTEWYENLMYFYKEADTIKGLRIIGSPLNTDAGISMDITKINLDMSTAGIDGSRLEELLMERGIFAELTTGPILMCMTGIGNTLEDVKRLIEALKDISACCSAVPAPSPEKSSVPAILKEKLQLFPVPQDKERIPLTKGAGRICASSIIPYPPGIPFICPGEQLTDEVISYIKQLRDAGEKVIGINDRGEITVARQRT